MSHPGSKLRIVLITQDERLYLPLAVDPLLASLGTEVVMVCELPSFNEDRGANLKRFLRLYRPWAFFKLFMAYVAACLADRWIQTTGRRCAQRCFSIRSAARLNKVPYMQCRDANAPDFLEQLRTSLRPDLIISIAASQKFRQDLLDIPPMGCINLHSSPLPMHRGMMPNFWAMLQGDHPTWVTIHRMSDRLDAGTGILRRPVAIRSTDTLHRLMQRSKRIGAQALLAAVEALRHGSVKEWPIDLKAGSFHTFPEPRDGRALRALGHRLI